MKIRITSTNIRYNRDDSIESIDVLFNASNGRVEISSGRLFLTADEYSGNESIEKLETIARHRLAEGLEGNE